MSRAKSGEKQRRTVYLYASQPVENISDYQFSITAERIEFLLSLIDSLSLNYMNKVSLFLLYMFYKRKYYDAKSQYENFHVRNGHLQEMYFSNVLTQDYASIARSRW